jgi:hypothetical protein
MSLDKIKTVDWKNWISQHNVSDIDSTYDSFHKVIQENTVFEQKKINKKRVPICPWMTKFILDKKRKMEISIRKFLKKPTEKNKFNYKKLKKEYNYDIKKAKHDFYGKELFRANKDSKKMCLSSTP